MKKLMLRAGIVLLCGFLIQGCEVAGKQDFDCPTMPGGVGCTNSMNIHEVTNDVDGARKRIVERVKEDREGSDDDLGVEGLNSPVTWESGNGGKSSAQGGMSSSPSPMSIEQPTPVMENARFMRVLITPWVDSRSDLHMGEMIFTEITPKMWRYGVEEIRAKTISPVVMENNYVEDAKEAPSEKNNPMFDRAEESAKRNK